MTHALSAISMSRLLLTCLLFALGAPHSAAAEQTLRVMSFNVRVPVESDGPDRWEARRDLLVRTIRDARPDLLGTQELVKVQGDYLAKRLPEYAWFGSGRGGGDEGEHMGVFYRRDALRLLESGDFWLSDTPEVPGSISWGNLYPRMVTWGLFERRADGRGVYLFNTHLPYREEDGAVRVRSVALILQRLATLPPEVPVILVGDFNDVPDSPAYRALANALGDAWLEAPRRQGPDGTFHGFSGQAERRIDWMFHRGLQPRHARTLTDHADGRYPSDHFPVMVEFD